MTTVWQSDPDIHYQGSVVKSADEDSVTIEQKYKEEAKNIFDDTDNKSEKLSFEAVGDSEDIAEVFSYVYGDGSEKSVEDTLGGYIEDGGAYDELKDTAKILSSTFGVDLNKAKRFAKAGERQFERFWLKNVRQQNRRRRSQQDVLNTHSALDKSLQAENARVGPLGTQRISGQRLGSTPETDASEVRLGNG